MAAIVINNTVSTDSTKRQCADLDVHNESCIITRMTYGSAGGAISLWVTVIYCYFISLGELRIEFGQKKEAMV